MSPILILRPMITAGKHMKQSAGLLWLTMPAFMYFISADLPVIMAIADGIADEEDTGSKVRNWNLGRLKEFLISCRERFEE